MADDLAAKLARAFTLAAGRMLPTSGYQPGKVTELLAADLRVILEAGLPEWYAGYDAGCRDQARAAAPPRPTGRGPYTCPHGDPLCPCLGRGRDRAFEQGWDYEAERGDR